MVLKVALQRKCAFTALTVRATIYALLTQELRRFSNLSACCD